MNLKHLRYFLSVCETHSTTRSATILRVSQPAITRGIKTLEEELDSRLFDRFPREMRPTKYGEHFRLRVKSILVQLDEAHSELLHLKEQPDEEVSIGAGPTWSMGRLPAVLSKISQQFPNARLRVRGGYESQLVQLLREGEVDFILSEINENAETKDLSKLPLTHARYVVVARKDHVLASRTQVSLAKLRDFPWAMPDQAINAERRLDGLFRAHSLEPPVPVFQSTSLTAILKFLETSDALAFVVESTLLNHATQTLAALDVAVDLPVRAAGIMRRQDDWIGPVSQAIIEELERDSALYSIQ